MNTKFFIFLISTLFTGISCFAQRVTLSGRITDQHTNEPVQFASVYLAKKGNGSASDSMGHFRLTANIGDTLIVTFVGYLQARLPVTDSLNNVPFVIALERGSSAVSVIKTKVNKGLFLWKKIVSKKKIYNRYNLDNFGYKAYNKLEVDIKNFNPKKARKNFILKPFSFIFDNIDSVSEKQPFLPAYLLESISQYQFQRKPRKIHELIEATNTPSFQNESISKMLGVMNQNVNVYNNFINVMDKDFIGPFNDNADVYYDFRVPDTQIVNHQNIYHFVFTPKHAGQNTFEGDAWVLAKSWQLQKITLFLSKDANINYIDRISVFQEFQPVNDSLYFIKRDKFYADFSMLGKQSVSFIGRKTTSYHEIRINDPGIGQQLDLQPTEEWVETAPGINKHSDSAWNILRQPDSLTKNEKSIYATVDKLMKMPKFQKLKNTLKFIGTGYKEIGNYEIGPWYNWLSTNSWEGTRFRFDLGTNPGLNKDIYLHSYLAYGTLDKKWKGKTEAFWIVKREPHRARLHVSYSNDVDNGISNYGEVGQDNIFTLAIRKPNTAKRYLNVQDSRLEWFNEWGKGFSTEWFINHRRYTPLKNLPLKENFTVEQGEPFTNFEIALKLRFSYLEQFVEGNYFRYSVGGNSPVTELIFAQGIPGIFRSAYSYTKIGLLVHDFTKISPLGTLWWRVYGGKIFGSLPYPFLEIHPGNNIYYYNPYAFNLMNRFEYISDQYAGVNLEHNVGSGLFRFIPLTRKLKWRQFWNAKTLWGSVTNENARINGAYFNTLNGNTYMELGTGIDNIFKILRLDFVWRILPRPLPVQKSSRFGIFGSLQFQF